MIVTAQRGRDLFSKLDDLSTVTLHCNTCHLSPSSKLSMVCMVDDVQLAFDISELAMLQMRFGRTANIRLN